MKKFLKDMTSNLSVFKVKKTTVEGFFKATLIEFPYTHDQITHEGFLSVYDNGDGTCDIEVEFRDLNRESFIVHMAKKEACDYLEAHPKWGGTSNGVEEIQ